MSRAKKGLGDKDVNLWNLHQARFVCRMHWFREVTSRASNCGVSNEKQNYSCRVRILHLSLWKEEEIPEDQDLGELALEETPVVSIDDEKPYVMAPYVEVCLDGKLVGRTEIGTWQSPWNVDQKIAPKSPFRKCQCSTTDKENVSNFDVFENSVIWNSDIPVEDNTKLSMVQFVVKDFDYESPSCIADDYLADWQIRFQYLLQFCRGWCPGMYTIISSAHILVGCSNMGFTQEHMEERQIRLCLEVSYPPTLPGLNAPLNSPLCPEFKRRRYRPKNAEVKLKDDSAREMERVTADYTVIAAFIGGIVETLNQIFKETTFQFLFASEFFRTEVTPMVPLMLSISLIACPEAILISIHLCITMGFLCLLLDVRAISEFLKAQFSTDWQKPKRLFRLCSIFLRLRSLNGETGFLKLLRSSATLEKEENINLIKLASSAKRREIKNFENLMNKDSIETSADSLINPELIRFLGWKALPLNAKQNFQKSAKFVRRLNKYLHFPQKRWKLILSILCSFCCTYLCFRNPKEVIFVYETLAAVFLTLLLTLNLPVVRVVIASSKRGCNTLLRNARKIGLSFKEAPAAVIRL